MLEWLADKVNRHQYDVVV